MPRGLDIGLFLRGSARSGKNNHGVGLSLSHNAPGNFDGLDQVAEVRTGLSSLLCFTLELLAGCVRCFVLMVFGQRFVFSGL
jgi:hypothetical protein